MEISTLLSQYLSDNDNGKNKLIQLRQAITEALNDEQDYASTVPEWKPVRLLMRDDKVGGGYYGDSNKPIHDLSQCMAYIKQQNEIISEQATAGFILISSFEDGATLTLSNEVLLYEQDGQYYRWTGVLPKVVDANSTPDSTGGVIGGAWVLVGDGALRSQLKLDSGATMVSTETGLTVQDEINKKSTEIEILQYPVDLYFCTFFESNTNTRIKLGVSNDGINFSDLVVLKNNDIELTGRDPSIIYHNGYFLIAFTSSAINSHDFAVYRSKDLISWETIKCTMGQTPVKNGQFGDITNPGIWAPEFIIDENNDLYIAISIQYKANENDINGNSIPYFYPCLSKCTDVDALTFSYPEIIKIENVHISNKIDADILYDEGQYIMAVKNEYSKVIEIYKSTSILGEYTYFSDVPFSAQCEGPCIVKRKSGDYIVYADFFATGQELFYVKTNDFLNFSQETPLIAYDNVRHGTVSRTLNDPLVAQYLIKTVSVSNSNNKYLKFYNINNNTTIDLLPMEGFVYNIPGKVNATINLLPGAKEAYFCVGSAGWALLKLKNINGFPNNTLVLGCGYGHEQVVKIVKTPGSSTSYRAVGFSPILNTTNLYADAFNNTDINKDDVFWYPMYGRVYVTSGINPTVNIYKLPTDFNNGFYFYICIRSGSAGGAVTFKKDAGNFATPGSGDLTLSGNNGLDSKLIRVEYNAGTWFLQY